jgi:mRNA interferase MazF
MRPGDVVLIRLPQATGGPPKLRPALVLSLLPGPYQNVLICGISTQLEELEPDWDDLISREEGDFGDSGLRRPSAVRLSYLYASDTREVSGVIGRIAPQRLRRLRARLAGLLASQQGAEVSR